MDIDPTSEDLEDRFFSFFDREISWNGRTLTLFHQFLPQLQQRIVEASASFFTTPPSQRTWIGKALEIIGRGMIDPDLQNPDAPLPTAELSTHYKIEGIRLPQYRIGGINGMNTSFAKMESHAQYLHQFIPGYALDWVHNQTHGIVADLCEIFACNYFGYSPHTANLLLENWTQFHRENLDHLDAKYLQFCHSQGALHTKNTLLHAPEEIRKRLIVVAIAPAVIIPKDLCFESFNYASKNDIVNYGELFYAGLLDTHIDDRKSPLLELIKNRDQLILLDSLGEGIDHDFQSPTFAKKIKEHIEEYMKRRS